jgi:protein SCO1/2
MNRVQVIRYSVWGAAAVVLAIAAVVTWSTTRRTEDNVAAATATPPAPAERYGGPFTLITDTGTTLTQADLIGHPSILFFGFTSCPDVCPTAMAEASSWLTELGPEAGNLNVYFVTVDPERDTQDRLAQYLTAFHPDIVGLTGPADAVHAMLDSYGIYYRREPLANGDYTMDHSASFLLLDEAADFFGLIDYNQEHAAAMAEVRELLADPR